MIHDLDNLSGGQLRARDPSVGVPGYAMLLEVKRRRVLCEVLSSADMIRECALEGDAQIAVDLLFAEYLEERERG